MTGCEALIFDVDGTIADTEEWHRQAFNRAFQECRLSWVWGPRLYAELLQVTGGKERITHYIEVLRLPAAERRCLQRGVPRIHRAKTRAYRQLILNGEIKPRSGIRRLMLEARRRGIRLAIASTTSPENIEPLLTSALGAEALGWFESIAAGDVVARKKPAPDIYNAALAALSISAARAIAFEDSAIGVQSATTAGLFTVATPSLWTQGQDFAAANLLLRSLGDPDEPLTAEDERRVGERYLSLERLTALHIAARTQVGQN